MVGFLRVGKWKRFTMTAKQTTIETRHPRWRRNVKLLGPSGSRKAASRWSSSASHSLDAIAIGLLARIHTRTHANACMSVIYLIVIQLIFVFIVRTMTCHCAADKTRRWIVGHTVFIVPYKKMSPSSSTSSTLALSLSHSSSTSNGSTGPSSNGSILISTNLFKNNQQ